MMENEKRDEVMPRQEIAAERVPAISILGALAAGVVGAVVWAGIALATDYEIGWIAWGIGAAVGAAYFKLGGRAAAGPVLCAVIAFASIAGGKYAAYRIAVGNELEEFLDSPLLRMQFEATRNFGKEYAAAGTEAEKEKLAREWVVEAGEDPLAVSSTRLEQFRKVELPEVMAIAEGRRSYEEFTGDFEEAAMAEVSFSDTLSGFDLLWIFLGVGTAFRLAAGAVEGSKPAVVEESEEPS